MTSRLAAPLLLAFAALASAGTCSEPPPWRALGGSWVNASWGPGATVELEGVQVDLDVAMTLQAPTPEDRTPQPVTGTVCVNGAAGLAGTYQVDPATSRWAGSDYGGARLDFSASTSDGRTLAFSQGFMTHAVPERLDNAILTFRAADGSVVGTVSFEDFVQRGDVACP